MKRFVVVGCVALATVGVVAVSSRSAVAEPKAYGGGSARSMFVTSVTPRRNQEMLPDLSDPGANNVITVRFSAPLEEGDVLDDHGGLGPKCGFHDQTLAAIPATASVYRNVLTINPFGASRPVLPQGRYTLALSSAIHSTTGRRLASAFTTTFYVGSQTRFAPVLLRVTPTSGATRVAVRRVLVATFDEPIDLASATAAVRLEDRSTVPPTPIAARVRLARRGHAVVVTPTARSSYPRGADVALIISGQGSATDASAPVLTETDGHKFTRDRGPSWSVDASEPTLFHSVNGDFDDETGEFTLTFRTRGVAGR